MVAVSGEIKKSGLIDYPFPLRKDVTAHFILPRDLTNVEVERIYQFLQTLIE